MASAMIRSGFRTATSFRARLRACGLPRFQVRTHFGQDALRIVIVSSTDRADVTATHRQAKFQHHNPLLAIFRCKRAVILNRGGTLAWLIEGLAKTKRTNTNIAFS